MAGRLSTIGEFMVKGDLVVPIHNVSGAAPFKVLDIKDFGLGKGKERVTVALGNFHRFYSIDELQVIETLETSDPKGEQK